VEERRIVDSRCWTRDGGEDRRRAEAGDLGPETMDADSAAMDVALNQCLYFL
jgi:hypothetical protein